MKYWFSKIYHCVAGKSDHIGQSLAYGENIDEARQALREASSDLFSVFNPREIVFVTREIDRELFEHMAKKTKNAVT